MRAASPQASDSFGRPLSLRLTRLRLVGLVSFLEDTVTVYQPMDDEYYRALLSLVEVAPWGCWMWRGEYFQQHPQFRGELVYRLLWEQEFGPVPEKQFLFMGCQGGNLFLNKRDEPPKRGLCVRPTHRVLALPGSPRTPHRAKRHTKQIMASDEAYKADLASYLSRTTD